MLVRLCRDFLASWPERGYGFSSCFFRLALAQSLENLSLCSACQCVRFCSKEHQRAFWPRRGSDASMSREREGGGWKCLHPWSSDARPESARDIGCCGSLGAEPTSRRADGVMPGISQFASSLLPSRVACCSRPGQKCAGQSVKWAWVLFCPLYIEPKGSLLAFGFRLSAFARLCFWQGCRPAMDAGLPSRAHGCLDPDQAVTRSVSCGYQREVTPSTAAKSPATCLTLAGACGS